METFEDFLVVKMCLFKVVSQRRQHVLLGTSLWCAGAMGVANFFLAGVTISSILTVHRVFLSWGSKMISLMSQEMKIFLSNVLPMYVLVRIGYLMSLGNIEHYRVVCLSRLCFNLLVSDVWRI